MFYVVTIDVDCLFVLCQIRYRLNCRKQYTDYQTEVLDFFEIKEKLKLLRHNSKSSVDMCQLPL